MISLRLRSNRATIAQQFRNDCATILKQSLSRNDRAVTLQGLESDCATIAKRSRNDHEANAQKLRGGFVTIAH
jgi:DNA gyrase inhibitor GyrI